MSYVVVEVLSVPSDGCFDWVGLWPSFGFLGSLIVNVDPFELFSDSVSTQSIRSLCTGPTPETPMSRIDGTVNEFASSSTS